MDKIWLKSYPTNIPADINPDTYSSLTELFLRNCQQYAHHPAFYNMGVTLSYNELQRYAESFAAYLQQELKLEKGSRIAIILPNLLHYPVALFGSLLAGLVVVNVNPLYTAEELSFQLQDAEVKAVVALETVAHTLQKSLLNITIPHIIIAKVGDFMSFPRGYLLNWVIKYWKKKIRKWAIPKTHAFKTVLSRGQKLNYTPVSLSGEDIAFLQYTGGTTGIAKGAVLTHRNIVANLQQVLAWIMPWIVCGQEIIITALPLYHIFSLVANALLMVASGGLSVLVTDPRHMPSFIREMKRFKFTAITGVNTLFSTLLSEPSFQKIDFSALKFSLSGGMPLQPVIAKEWQKLTKVPLIEGYGLTEASPCVSINPLNIKMYNGTVGLPLPSTLIKVVDNHYNTLPIGQAGELCIRGPQVMHSYWRNTAETEKVFTPDGWLLTGDIATIDADGYIRIIDRKKDMILVSGFNVYPLEVEQILYAMPGIIEAAVVGVPDEKTGEAVKAVVVREDQTLTESDVKKYCRDHLTHYKIPKIIIFVNSLPKSSVGKLLRKNLRDL